MKSFESEKRELFDWLCKEKEKYRNAVKKMRSEGIISRDIEAGLEYQKAKLEYNQKLLALKKKYNIK